MDPNACWKRLMETYRDQEWDEVVECVDALNGWVERGGFLPAVFGAFGEDGELVMLMAIFRLRDVASDSMEHEAEMERWVR